MSTEKVAGGRTVDVGDDDPSTTHRGRKKADGGGVRTWFRLTSTGRTMLLDMGKHAVKQRTGLSTRDYRILDPLLAYPATILGRRKAIVVNLGHIRGIITTRDVWLLNYKDPSVAPFIEELKRRVMKYNGREVTTENDPTATEANQGNLHDHSQELKSTASSRRQIAPVIDLQQEAIQGQEEEKEVDRMIKVKTKEKQRASRFEFMVLEACLENLCAKLDFEFKTLELEAYPSLDELNVKISKFTLDCVRQVKGRLVLLNNCIQKIKEEIDNMLGKDELMAGMYLADNSHPGGLQDRVDTMAGNDGDEGQELYDRIEEDYSLQGEIHEAGATSGIGTSKRHQVTELERLLETYLIRFGATLTQVSSLKEQIHDMESYLTLVLDDKQNGLLQLIIHLKTGNAVVQFYSIYTAFMASSITISLFNGNYKDSLMWWTNSVWLAVTILGHVCLIGLYKYKGWFI
ncbi:hypothetical protein MLD38_032401 [Melastoma candidum]|uniref:Uncharacterized protein n=1 Tax=Melastoma candidum TaxID=119954 RepID=A0ACB9M5B9_9MYRT|nr:hypothetical protein MLD38_032401 [Melastoma candidum]